MRSLDSKFSGSKDTAIYLALYPKIGFSFILVPSTPELVVKWVNLYRTVLVLFIPSGWSLVLLVTVSVTACILFAFLAIVRRCRQVDVDLKSQQTSNEGKHMTTFFEERLSKDFISEKLEGQLDEIKQQLEEISRCESINSILAEELCKARELFKKDSLTKDDIMALGEILNRISSSTSSFATRHQKKLSQKTYKELKLNAYTFKVSGKTCQIAASPLLSLKSKDSLKNLKKWCEALETYAEFLDGGDLGNLPPEIKLYLQKLCIIALEATSQVYIDNPKKEKCRRALRNSASFILQWIQNYSQTELENFAVGSLPGAKLLEETKNRLHLLDLLSPSNNEEATEQRETRQYLRQVLGD